MLEKLPKVGLGEDGGIETSLLACSFWTFLTAKSYLFKKILKTNRPNNQPTCRAIDTSGQSIKIYLFICCDWKHQNVSIKLLRSAVLWTHKNYHFVCVHRTAEVRSSMDTSPLCRKVSIKLLRSAVLWGCLESVHRTADLSSSMDTVGKGDH